MTEPKKHTIPSWYHPFIRRCNEFVAQASSTREKRYRVRRLMYDPRFNLRARGSRVRA